MPFTWQNQWAISTRWLRQQHCQWITNCRQLWWNYKSGDLAISIIYNQKYYIWSIVRQKTECRLNSTRRTLAKMGIWKIIGRHNIDCLGFSRSFMTMNDFALTILATVAVNIYIPHKLDDKISRKHQSCQDVLPKKRRGVGRKKKASPPRKLMMCGRCGNRRIGSLHDCGARKNSWDYCRNKTQWKANVQETYRCLNIPVCEENEKWPITDGPNLRVAANCKETEGIPSLGVKW